MKDTVLAVDIGTTSLKAGLLTADGEVVFIFRKKYRNSRNKYVALQWVTCFKSAYEKAVVFCQSKKFQIKGICISGNGPTVVCENGLTLLWNGLNLPENYSKNLDSDLAEKISQNKIPSLFLPRILLLKQTYPDEFFNASRIFSGPEFLIYKLTGKEITILPEKRYASAYWNDSLLETFGISKEKFPPFVFTGHNCGEWDGIPVFAGGPDFIVALIGTNTLGVGRICDRSGSSEGINFCVPIQIFENGIRTLPSVIPDLWNCSVLIPESSKLSNNQRKEKLIAAMDLLKSLSKKYKFDFPSEIKVTGGQTKDYFWMQEKASFLNLKLMVCSCSDSELLGDASIAWFGLKKYKSLQEAAKNIVKIKKSFIPKKLRKTD